MSEAYNVEGDKGEYIEEWELPHDLVKAIADEVMRQMNANNEETIRIASKAAIEQYKKEREARIFKIKDMYMYILP